MGIRAEHDSLEVFLKGALSDDDRRRVLFVSFTQWGFALAALADTAACLSRMGSEPVLAFWLPTSGDRFYPDFVARLTDGRILVSDYKGADRASNDDTREKAMFGQFWEQADPVRHLFMMVTKKDVQGRDIRAQFLAKIGPA